MSFKLVALALVAAIGFSGAQQADAKKAERPCQFHTSTTKVTKQQCVAQYKKTTRAKIRATNLKNQKKRELRKRDSQFWPSAPVTTRDLKVRGVNIRAFARLGICEAGPGSGAFGVRWNTPSGFEYEGGLGMFRSSHYSVGHPYGSMNTANWQTQMLVAERLKMRYGITAWTAHRCYG